MNDGKNIVSSTTNTDQASLSSGDGYFIQIRDGLNITNGENRGTDYAWLDQDRWQGII